MKKIALLMGNRLSKWHVMVFEGLAGMFDVKAFAPSSNLFDTGDIGLPIEPVYYENEVGNWIARKSKNLKYRLFKRFGYNIALCDFTARLKDFDIIHTWELYTQWSYQAAMAKERYGNKLIVTVWDTIPFNVETSKEVLRRKEKVISNADLFIVYSNKSREMLLLEGIDSGKITYIAPSVDTERFKWRNKNVQFLQQFGLDAKDIVVLFVGRLVREKGAYDLLYGFKKLMLDRDLKGISLKLLILGNGPEHRLLEDMVKRLGLSSSCLVHGGLPYSSMNELYNLGDIFIIPSISTHWWEEQFCMAALEAMASGLAVIASTSGALEEVVGDCGLYVAPSDFVSIHAKLKSLVVDEELRKMLSIKSRKRAVDHFSILRSREGLSKIYAQLSENG